MIITEDTQRPYDVDYDFSDITIKAETWMPAIQYMFKKTLDVPGHVIEVGCYKGGVALRLAKILKEEEISKRVYALDTFEGFVFDDPSGGPMKAGVYSDIEGGEYDIIQLSGKLGLDVEPWAGDCRETLKSATLRNKKYSFAWIDVDFNCLITEAFFDIEKNMHKDGIIGIDDIGRPECPGAELALHNILKEGKWEIALFDKLSLQVFLRRKR